MTRGRIDGYNERIGARLRALRKLHNYSQQKVAEQIGSTFQQVQKYESGTNQLSLVRVHQLAPVFNMSDIDFFQYLLESIRPESYVLAKKLDKLTPSARKLILDMVAFFDKDKGF